MAVSHWSCAKMWLYDTEVVHKWSCRTQTLCTRGMFVCAARFAQQLKQLIVWQEVTHPGHCSAVLCTVYIGTCCTALHCTCTALHLHCTALHLHCTALHCTSMQCSAPLVYSTWTVYTALPLTLSVYWRETEGCGSDRLCNLIVGIQVKPVGKMEQILQDWDR